MSLAQVCECGPPLGRRAENRWYLTGGQNHSCSDCFPPMSTRGSDELCPHKRHKGESDALLEVFSNSIFFTREKISRMRTNSFVWEMYVRLTSPPPLKSSTQLGVFPTQWTRQTQTGLACYQTVAVKVNLNFKHRSIEQGAL